LTQNGLGFLQAPLNFFLKMFAKLVFLAEFFVWHKFFLRLFQFGKELQVRKAQIFGNF
jgi:hypothetical protein